MKNSRPLAGALLAVLTCLASAQVAAGPYADDMAKCLVKSASPEDRTLLVKWIFSAMTLHPDLASMSAITTQQRDALTKSAGALFQRLLLEACRPETQQAIQNEGPQTIQYAFQVLGQVATRGLFMDPHVLEGMKGLSKDLDEGKLKALLSAPAQK
jgi:hypothetical protein